MITWDLELGRGLDDIPYLNQECHLCLDTSVTYVMEQDTVARSTRT